MKLSRWLPALERLEAREVPAVTAALSQTATWADIGPTNITAGQVRNIGADNASIGAVQALAFHPSIPTTLFAGSPNGGLWRTTNANAATPTWTPIADQVASMSIADIAIDPDNPNRLVAAVGATADGWQLEGGQANRVRGDLIGLLYTDDAQAGTPTWRFLSNNLAGKNVLNVFLRTGYILAATDQGTFRSSDNGVTFNNIYPSTIDNGVTYTTRQFNQGVYDMAENPRLRDQFYLATKPGAGLATSEIWRTDDGGLTWGRVTDAAQMQMNARTVNVQLTVRDTGAFDNQVYVAVSNDNPVPGGAPPISFPGPEQSLPDLTIPGHGIQYGWQNHTGVLTSITWSTNQGGNWTRMDAPREMTDPEGLDFGVRDPDGIRNGVAVKNVGGGADINGGVVTIFTPFAHRMQTGDKVFVRGIYQWETPAPPNPNPELVNGFFSITVTSSTSFTLDNLTLTVAGLDSIEGYWQRVVGANPGERGEFLQLATSNAVGQERVFLGGDFKQFKFEDFDNSLNFYYPGLDNDTQPISFTGTVWSGNRLTTPQAFESRSTQWGSLTDVNTPGLTAPGGDTREMVLQSDGGGNLFMWVATGTGIYRRQIDPTGATNFNWTSANGNIEVGQFWSASYDSLNNVVAGATQDTGAVESGANSNTYAAITDTTRRNFLTDQEYSYVTAVDNTSTPGRAIRYYATSNFNNVRRREFNAANTLVGGGNTALNFADALTTNAPRSGITQTDLALAQDPSARIVIGLNVNDRRRGVYGLTSVYEDSDPNGVTGFVVSNVTPPGMNGARVTTMAYGGKRAGINFNQILAVGTNTGQLWLRSEFGVTFNQIAPGTGQVTDIEFDPDDYRHMFVVQGGKVYEIANITNGVSGWLEVSAGLVAPPDPATGLPSGGALTTQIRTIALFDPTPGTANIGAAGDVVLLAGGRGGVFRRTLTVCGTGTVWSEYGNGLPNSVVTELQFDSTGNRLTAATFGRGVWSIPDVRPTLNTTITLAVTSDAAGDNIIIAPDALDPNSVIVTANGTQIGRFSFGQFDRITVTGNGGADTVQIGNASSGKFVNYPIGVDMGGDVGDTLIVNANGSTADIQATITSTTVGATAGDTIFSGCGSLTYSGLLAGGTLELRTGSGHDRVILAPGVYPQAIFTNTASGNDLVFLSGSSSANVTAIDVAGNDDTLQISVPAGLTVTGSSSNVFNIGSLNVTTNGGFENLVFTGEGTGAAINMTGSGLNDDFFLMADPVWAPNGFSQLIVNTPGVPSQRIRFFNMHTVTVNGGAGTDRLIVDADALGAGGSTKFVNYLVNASMGGDLNDAIILNDSSTPTASFTTVTGNSVGAGVSDSLFGAGGRLFFAGLGAGRMYLTTGAGSDYTLFDTSLPLSVTYEGGGGFNVAGFSGTAGNDIVYVGGATVVANQVVASTNNVQRHQVFGNGGYDTVYAGGTAGDDAMSVSQSGLQSGALGGIAIPFDYFGLEALALLPYGGTNSLSWFDVSNTAIGSPTNPGTGIDFVPTGAASGLVRMASGAGTTTSFDGVNSSFLMNGDPFSTNTGDVLTVFGTSTTGLASFGEATSPNGSDTIYANEDGVVISNAALGITLRPVGFGRTTGGSLGFANVWVRGGNEAGTGDTFVSLPTNRTNLLLDGGDPAVQPGDTLLVSTNGPASSAPVSDPALGPPHTRITNRSDRASVGYINFEQVTVTTPDPGNPTSPPVPSFGSPASDLFAVGSDGLGLVQVYNLDGSLRYTLNPYLGYTGPIQVAVGDVTGDGKSDVITAPGAGVGPHVKVFNGQTGAEHYSFFAYDAAFTGGVTVAVGNFNKDQYADIVTGVGPGGGPHVKLFDGASNAVIRGFFAYDPGFTGGVNVATGDLNGDGLSEIITGTASQATHVKAFDGVTNATTQSFFAFGGFNGGVSVAAGDVSGDGLADIIVGAGPGSDPQVKVFDAVTNGEIRSFVVNDPNVPGTPPITITGGVNVAASDIDQDGLVDILTGRGRGFRPFAQYFKVTTRFGGGVTPTQSTLLAVNTFGDSYSNGISVGA